MSNIISFFQKLIKGGGGLENFSKINKRGGGTIIRYWRVRSKFAHLISIAGGKRKSRSSSRTRRKKFGSWVGGAW